MIDFFLETYKQADSFDILIEIIVFVFGIVSVYFAKRENILVYPTGLVATILSTYLFMEVAYYGDAMVNGYFSIMSIYGWYYWGKTDKNNDKAAISRTSVKEKLIGILIFFVTIVVVFGIYKWSGKTIEADNFIDIALSGLFFTAMWYMAHKKIENWTLWIIGDLIAVPLYAYRGYGILALQYVIFTILAVLAYLEWKKTLNKSLQQGKIS